MLDDKLKDETGISVVVALGSNLLDPAGQVLAAMNELKFHYHTAFRASSIYRTAPISM